MKIYEKEYEDHYTRPVHIEKFNEQDIIVDGKSLPEYAREMRLFFEASQETLWEMLIKIHWLSSKIVINGERKNSITGNGRPANYYYNVFMRWMVGREMRMFLSSRYFRQIATYFTTIFPDFFQSDPFKVKYEYPFKHVTFDHLIFVGRMEERMELLEIAEKQKMPLTVFYDYILNYIHCFNAELGEEQYFLRKMTDTHEFDCIMNTKKYEKTKINHVPQGRIKRATEVHK